MEVDVLLDIGFRIVRRRKQLNISQKELASRTGITEATLSRYENNIREPKAEIIAKLANVLNTSTDYLLCNTNKPDVSFAKEPSDPYTSKPALTFDVSSFPDEATDEITSYISYIKHKYNL